MFNEYYDSVEKRISIWKSIVFMLILIGLYILFESKSAFGWETILGRIVIVSFILVVQAITFLVSHRIFVFAVEKRLKKKFAVNKYYAMVLFNYCLFSLAFFFLFMTFWSQRFVPLYLYDILVFILIFVAIPFFILTFAFNIILLKNLFVWNYPKAFAGFFIIATLTAVLYIINPVGGLLYFVYILV